MEFETVTGSVDNAENHNFARLVQPDRIMQPAAELFDRIEVRSAPPYPFIASATLPLPIGMVRDRFSVPLSIHRSHVRDDPEVPVQWEIATRYPDGSAAVVEALFPDFGNFGSFRSYAVRDKPMPVRGGGVRLPLWSVLLALTSGRVRAKLVFQDGEDETLSLSAPLSRWKIAKSGAALWELYRFVESENHGLGYHVIVTVDSLSGATHWTLNVCNPGGSRDVFYSQLRILVEGGRSSLDYQEVTTNEETKGASDSSLSLVTWGKHYWPQGWEREWRFSIHPPASAGRGVVWGTSRLGWGNELRAGFLAQRLRLPVAGTHLDEAQVRAEVATRAAEERTRLAQGLPTEGGNTGGRFGPWAYAGVLYGGMTGGIAIEQFPGALALIAGTPEGLEMHRIRALRYACRQRGGMYDEATGEEVRAWETTPDPTDWRHFNYGFQKKRPGTDPQPGGPQDTLWDDPLHWDLERRGAGRHRGTSPYEDAFEGGSQSPQVPAPLMPIDYQHTTRASKDSRALVYLSNDTLAKGRIITLAENARWTYKIRNRDLALPGNSAGRGDAWVLDLACHAYDIGTDGWREGWRDWFELFAVKLEGAQLPSGVFQHQATGKQAVGSSAEPNSHRETDACPLGIHGKGTDPDRWKADFSVGRANEHVFLCHALRAATEGPLFAYPRARTIFEKAVRVGLDFIWPEGMPGPHQRHISEALTSGGTRVVFGTYEELRDYLVDAASVNLGLEPIEATQWAADFLGHPNLRADSYHVASVVGYLADLDKTPHGDALRYLHALFGMTWEGTLGLKGTKQIDSRAGLYKWL